METRVQLLFSSPGSIGGSTSIVTTCTPSLEAHGEVQGQGELVISQENLWSQGLR